jgi:hypothetical protein
VNAIQQRKHLKQKNIKNTSIMQQHSVFIQESNPELIEIGAWG